MHSSLGFKTSMAAAALAEGLMGWREVLDKFTVEELRAMEWDPEVLAHPVAKAYLEERGVLE